PYPWGKDPDKSTILVPAGQKSEEKNATRWLKGDLTGSDPVYIPVDPKTVPIASNAQVLLLKAMVDIKTILNGNKDDPTKETGGRLKDGDDLADSRHKIAIAQ